MIQALALTLLLSAGDTAEAAAPAEAAPSAADAPAPAPAGDPCLDKPLDRLVALRAAADSKKPDGAQGLWGMITCARAGAPAIVRAAFTASGMGEDVNGVLKGDKVADIVEPFEKLGLTYCNYVAAPATGRAMVGRLQRELLRRFPKSPHTDAMLVDAVTSPSDSGCEQMAPGEAKPGKKGKHDTSSFENLDVLEASQELLKLFPKSKGRGAAHLALGELAYAEWLQALHLCEGGQLISAARIAENAHEHGDRERQKAIDEIRKAIPGSSDEVKEKAEGLLESLKSRTPKTDSWGCH